MGQRVVWQYKSAGGLGYEISAQATVTKIGKAKIQIEAPKQSGELVRRWVTPESIKPYQEVVSEPGPKHATRAKAEPNAQQSLGLGEWGARSSSNGQQGLRVETRLKLPESRRTSKRRQKSPTSEKPYTPSEDQIRKDAAWRQVEETGKPLLFEGTLLVPSGMKVWDAIEFLPDDIRDQTRTAAQDTMAKVIYEMIRSTRARLRDEAEKRGELAKWNSFPDAAQMAVAQSIVEKQLGWPETPIKDLIRQYGGKLACDEQPDSNQRQAQ